MDKKAVKRIEKISELLSRYVTYFLKIEKGTITFYTIKYAIFICTYNNQNKLYFPEIRLFEKSDTESKYIMFYANKRIDGFINKLSKLLELETSIDILESE